MDRTTCGTNESEPCTLAGLNLMSDVVADVTVADAAADVTANAYQ